MKIFNIGNIGIYNLNNAAKPSYGPRMSAPLSKDTVSFSARRLKEVFQSKQEAMDYYKNLGEQVTQSLKDEDELTAFELLGYKVDSDFETDKITINGNYKPFFTVITPHFKTGIYITYEDVGIDEEKLLQNVETVTGYRFVSPSFKPDKDYVIDRELKYFGDSAKNIDSLLQQRADEAKHSIEQGDYQKALNILGYKTEADAEGNITIKGNYSSKLLSTDKGTITLGNYGISENALLAKVVKIEGEAQFQKSFSPDHYIETGFISVVDDYFSSDNSKRIAYEFIKQSPKFVETIQKVNEALAKKDSYTALKELGYDVSKDENGKITINGNLRSFLRYDNNGVVYSLYYDSLGINSDDLLIDVSHITGDLDIFDTSLEKVDKDLKVDGTVYCGKYNNAELFKDFLSVKSVSDMYEGITPEVIESFVKYGAITPSIKTQFDTYFSEIEGKNKEFLDGIVSRRDEILTSDEIAKKYYVSQVSVDHALQKGILKPYGIKDLGTSLWHLKSNEFMFDVTDEANKEGLKKLESLGRRKLNSLNKAHETISSNNFQAACQRNGVRVKGDDSSIQYYPATALEAFGYGSKADIMANCKLRKNAYELKRYIMTHNSYDISSPEMMDILLNARHNNPTIMKLSDLMKILGEHKQEFTDAVMADKINVITQNPYRLIYLKDYMIDLSDKKNLEFLKTIDNADFQTLLSDRLAKSEAYKAQNQAELEKFRTQKPPTSQERAKEINDQLDLAARQRKEQERLRKLEIIAKKQERRRNLSLRNAIAWVYCPNTLQVKKENADEYINSIFDKYKELGQIREELLAQDITPEEAKARIKALNLSKQDEISVLAYHKKCWEIAGTQEWTEALHKAKEIMEIYKTQGITAIEDEEVRERIISWEKEHRK